MAEDELPEREEAEDPLFCGDEPDITAEELNNHLFGLDSKSDWFPYPDKAQQAVLSWAKDLGANVPAYSTFRKTQAALQAEVGDPNVRQESGRSTMWYMNEIGDSIKKDTITPHCSGQT
ncbi:hypothetical protein B0H10DRAFT_1945649 [Mycena sp. CBHHK59/15]|nr:hypothetical protein B0H10DRAFT_1945649 [Mycena sp. CBHHK59/15]